VASASSRACPGPVSGVVQACRSGGDRYRFWHIAKSCCNAKTGRNRGMADIASGSTPRMGGAQRYPSIAVREVDGFREGLNPSYALNWRANP
jgi:hypothetical protein